MRVADPQFSANQLNLMRSEMMIRTVVAVLSALWLSLSPAAAQNCAVSNTLTNGQNADATQVMANFNAILNCVNNLPSATTPLANSLAADVALNNTILYFDGPSVMQGSLGTWFASGTILVTDT